MYFTEDQLEKYLGININAGLATWLATMGAAVKQYIDETCSTEGVGRRWFDDADTETTRYFDGNGLTRLYVDDLRSVTSLVASITAGNGVTLVLNTDYFLYPLNAVADSKPYEYIELANPAFNLPANSRITTGVAQAYIFFEGQRNIAITGKWGYNAASGSRPDLITLAALKIMGGIIKENIGDDDVKELTQETLGEYSASYAKVKDIADRLGIPDTLAPFIRARKASGGGIRKVS